MPPKSNDVVSVINNQTPSTSSPVLPKSQPEAIVGKGKNKKPIKTTRAAELSDDAKLMNARKLIYGSPIKNADDFNAGVKDINQLVNEMYASGLTANYDTGTSGGGGGQAYGGDQYRTALIGAQGLAPELKPEEYSAVMNRYLSEVGQPEEVKEADSKEAKHYKSRGNPREHFARLAEGMLQKAMELGIKNSAEFMENKDRIFTEDMKSPGLEKRGYYGNLFPALARLYEKKMANFKPISNEEAIAIRGEEDRKLAQKPKSTVSPESMKQVEQAAQRVLPKSSQ